MISSDDLKKIQTPLKEKYKTAPDKAFVTLKAIGKIGEEISCNVETGKRMVEAGLHPATGGSGALACSGDMLLEALVACAGVTLSAVATAISFQLEGGVVCAEGDLDFRGTLGVSKDVNVGFKDIRLTFELDTRETGERVDALLKLTERYCVVFQTLKVGVPVNVTISTPDFKSSSSS
ncbi:OsmC family protein [Chryseolinea sp. H1M3-3]|uniref:OsmC family protein n=1 Tax=Chryseolinea sp. H1M3-3 TaxID=3034144 RepID=UPI0023ECF7A6|nr:OsmC family protein [Chryseolinea sp. H1M3-3]